MDRYGTDYGMRGSWNRGAGRDFGRGMDRGFEWGEGRGNFGRSTGRERGFGGSSYDEGWRSMDRDRFGYEGGFNEDYGSYTGGYHPGHGAYGAHGGYRGRGIESGDYGFYDRDMYGSRDRGFDRGFGRGQWEEDRGGFTDRMRHGWNRMRDEARGWMGGRGRGYDRGW